MASLPEGSSPTLAMRVKALLIALTRAANWRGVFVYSPGIVLVVLLVVVFWNLEQGRDTIRQSLDDAWRTGLHVMGLTFMAWVTWYGSRMVAFARWETVARVPFVRSKGPRFLGFGCFTATIVAVLVAGGELLPGKELWLLLTLLLGSLVWFGIIERFADQWSDGHWQRGRARAVMYGLCSALLGLGLIALCCGRHSWLHAFVLFLMQTVFGVFTALRTALLKGIEPQAPRWAGNIPPPKRGWLEHSFPRERGIKSRSGFERVLSYDIEYKYYKRFVIVSALMVLLYAVAAGSLWASRTLGPFAVALLGAGVLIGFANALRVVKYTIGIPLGAFIFLLMLIVGRCSDPHDVRTVQSDAASGNETRPGLHPYLRAWFAERVPLDSAAFTPVYMVLADGGASRSGYWVVQALGRIQAEKGRAFSDRLLCLSGASGGSVGIGVFHAMLRSAGGKPELDFRRQGRVVLGSDLLSPTLSSMLCTDLINLALPVFEDRAARLELGLEDAGLAAGLDFGQGMRTLVSTGRPAQWPILCLNTVRMQDGTPSYSSNVRLDASAFSVRADVLEAVGAGYDMRQSTAMILSSRFPYISPAGCIESAQGPQYFVDGGYFDNSGAGVVDELIATIDSMLNDESPGGLSQYKGKFALHVLHISNSEPPDSAFHSVHPVANDATAPLLTVAGTYASQTDVNNARLKRRIAAFKGHYALVNLYEHEGPGMFDSTEMSMNWVISRGTLDHMDYIAAHHFRLDSLIRTIP